MSGGVDSSVTAGLLKQQGYDVIGITLRLWEEDPACTVDNIHACCSLSSVDDAKAVASVLGIPHYTLDFRELFRRDVIDYFVDSYRRGKTPNPCITCNKFIKFGLLWEKAKQFGADFLATGHYARIAKNEETGIYSLLRDLEKTDTRKLAKEWNLPVFNKPESQDICFIPDNDYKGFLEKEKKDIFKPGDFVDEKGRVIGRHQGIAAYTVGQRRGLNLGGPGGPYYVTALDVEHNRVIVGSEKDLFSTTVEASEATWVEQVPTAPFRALGKIRYAANESPCTVYPDGDDMRVEFDEAQRAVTAGQALVLYDAETGERVLGGGVIQ